MANHLAGTSAADLDELDENGFPISDLNDEVTVDEVIDSDFAMDFYSCGSDWSSLAEATEDEAGKEKRSLVQRDLFQMWGVKRPRLSSPGEEKLRRGLGSTLRRNDSLASKRLASDCGGGCKEVDGGGRRNRVCPFYKKISGTPFTVDAFRYGAIDGCSAYFLSHFHYDHYGGLTKRWTHGPIYCSPLTSRLVKMCLYVDASYIQPLELDTEYVIEGVKVKLLDANHCPGAALIHFQLRDGQTYLHTGDFRACKLMQSYPDLLRNSINMLYLDTTYCNPKYRFPPKEDVMDFVVQTTRKYLKKQPRTLIVVGAYSIGKENVYLAISQALKVPIFANALRRRILQAFNWPELSENLCSCGENSPLHVLPMSSLRHESLTEHLKTYKSQFTSVLAFRPTGWTFSESIGDRLDLIKPNSKGNVTIYGVPYSEHSSFLELRDFVKFLMPDKIIPTVNIGNPATREKMQAYFREWLKG